MSAISDLYIEQQVKSALIEAYDGRSILINELNAIVPRLISALDDRGIELRPR